MTPRTARFRCLALALLFGLLATEALAAQALNLGIFAYRPTQVLESRFQPLADYLGAQLGVEVRLHILTQEQMNEALARNQLDLFFTNPSHFLMIRSERSLGGAIATLIRRGPTANTSSLGGVILVRGGDSRYDSLSDLRNATIAVPGPYFLGGFQTQLFEFREIGIDLQRTARLRVLGSHDRVVRAVLEGDVNAGFVRTGIIEQLVEEGRLQRDDVRVLQPQELGEFPFVVSTRLYPEWPFVALPHVDQKLVRRLASSLFALAEDHPAARAGDIAGFAPPADYQSVELLARSLRVPPYDRVPAVTWLDVLQQYRYWIFAVVLLISLLALTAIWLWRQRKRLVREQRRLSAMVETWPEPMLIIRRGLFVEANSAALQLLGYHRRESLAVQGLAGVSPPFQPDGEPSLEKSRALLQAVMDQGVQACEWRCLRNDASELYVDLTLARIGQHDDGEPAILCAFHDITRRKRAEAQQRLAASVFSHAREGIFITDVEGRVIDINDAYQVITGYNRNQSIGSLVELPDEGVSVLIYARTHGRWVGEFRSRRQDGEAYIKALTITAVRDDRQRLTHFVGIFSDITRLREQENRLTRMAHYDALTGLPNRVLLADRMHQAMAQARRQGYRLAVAYIDLDKFKPVNDAFGHEAGDELLVTLAGRMRTALREQDTVARLGGDEFVALLVDIPDRALGETLLQRLLTVIGEPVWVAGHSVQVSASIGVALYPGRQELDGDQLLREADQAMYHAKQLGRNRYWITASDRGGDAWSP